MKSYDVTVSVTFKKPMKINACCGDEAISKAKDILFNTDIQFHLWTVKNIMTTMKAMPV